MSALIFVGQGSLGDHAEIDRQSWNATFRAQGMRWDWSWDAFVELLRPGGYFRPVERYAEFLDVTVDPARLYAAHGRAYAARMLDGVALRSGVAEVLRWAETSGLKLALVTRSRPSLVHCFLAATARARAGVEFDLVLSRDDTLRPVPHPDGVLQALETLGVAASDALAISESPAGAAAALDAGVATLVVPGLLAEGCHFPRGVHEAHRLSPGLCEALLSPQGHLRAAAE